MTVQPDVELVERYEFVSEDAAEVLLFIAEPDAFPVRLRVIDDENSAVTAWMTVDEAEALATRLLGVARRADREGRQA